MDSTLSVSRDIEYPEEFSGGLFRTPVISYIKVNFKSCSQLLSRTLCLIIFNPSLTFTNELADVYYFHCCTRKRDSFPRTTKETKTSVLSG